LEVEPGHHTAMLLPVPARPRIICLLRPSPKDSSMTIATVPQAIAATVSTARFRLSDEAFENSDQMTIKLRGLIEDLATEEFQIPDSKFQMGSPGEPRISEAHARSTQSGP